MAQASEVPIVKRGSSCSRCFSQNICVCNVCKCRHASVDSDKGFVYVCPGNNYLFLERIYGKRAMNLSSANRTQISLVTRVVRFGEGDAFNDELKASREQVAKLTRENDELKTLREQVAQLTRENEELRRFKAAVEAAVEAAEAKAAVDTQSATDT